MLDPLDRNNNSMRDVGWNTVGMMKLGLSSLVPTTIAIASGRPQQHVHGHLVGAGVEEAWKTPGKASTLLIWLG